jgi:hypothetical protein
VRLDKQKNKKLMTKQTMAGGREFGDTFESVGVLLKLQAAGFDKGRMPGDGGFRIGLLAPFKGR